VNKAFYHIDRKFEKKWVLFLLWCGFEAIFSLSRFTSGFQSHHPLEMKLFFCRCVITPKTRGIDRKIKIPSQPLDTLLSLCFTISRMRTLTGEYCFKNP
jgi:hypothetical protein